ncbi:MAG: hypothetical protein Q8P01_00405 [bacterium]|nr:hypothetical protein [bacterium]
MRYFFSIVFCFVLFVVFSSFVFAEDLAPSLSITAPVAGAQLSAGTPVNVAWNLANAPQGAEVRYLAQFPKDNKGGVVSRIVTTPSYTWTIPMALPSASYTILVKALVRAEGKARIYQAQQSIHIAAIPVIEITSPLGGLTFQPGNRYTFSWMWKEGTYVFSEQGWSYALGQTLVRKKSSGVPDGTLDSWFGSSLAERFSRVQNGGVGVNGDSFEFTFPESRDGARFAPGVRVFTIRIQTKTPDGENGEVVLGTAEFDVTNIKGDVTGDGLVGYEDLMRVAEFIRDIPDTGTQQQSQYATRLAQFDLNQDKSVGTADLEIIVSRYLTRGQ